MAQLSAAEALAVELAQGARPVHVAAEITFWDRDDDTLQRQVTQAIRRLRRAGFRGVAQTDVHHVAVHQTLPGGVAQSGPQWMQTTSTAAFALCPAFHVTQGFAPAADFVQAGGHPFGWHPMPRASTNWNGVITGASGSGKSFLTNRLITSMLQIGGRVVVVDCAGPEPAATWP